MVIQFEGLIMNSSQNCNCLENQNQIILNNFGCEQSTSLHDDFENENFSLQHEHTRKQFDGDRIICSSNKIHGEKSNYSTCENSDQLFQNKNQNNQSFTKKQYFSFMFVLTTIVTIIIIPTIFLLCVYEIKQNFDQRRITLSVQYLKNTFSLNEYKQNLRNVRNVRNAQNANRQNIVIRTLQKVCSFSGNTQAAKSSDRYQHNQQNLSTEQQDLRTLNTQSAQILQEIIQGQHAPNAQNASSNVVNFPPCNVQNAQNASANVVNFPPRNVQNVVDFPPRNVQNVQNAVNFPPQNVQNAQNVQNIEYFAPQNIQNAENFPPLGVQNAADFPPRNMQNTSPNVVNFPPQNVQNMLDFPPRNVQNVSNVLNFPPQNVQDVLDFPPQNLQESDGSRLDMFLLRAMQMQQSMCQIVPDQKCIQEIIASLPKGPYKVNNQECKNDGDQICAICYDDFHVQEEDEGVTTTYLACDHWYHTHCIVKWIKLKGACVKCPLCNSPIRQNKNL